MARKRKRSASSFPRGLCLIVFAVGFLLYLPTLRFDFTFDDSFIVRGNPVIDEWGDWKGIFLSEYWPGMNAYLYRPVTMLSFALERAVHGSEAWGFHLTNAILHGLVGALVLLLARRMLGPGWASLFAALLFAVHPIHTEAVSGVVGRAELLAAFFGLWLFLIWTRRESTTGVNGIWAPALLFLLALGSKEHAVVLPALLLLWELALWKQREFRPPLLRLVGDTRFPALGAALVVFVLLRGSVVGWDIPRNPQFVENPLAHAAWQTRAVSAAANQARGLLLHLIPAPLIADYSHDTLPVLESAWNPGTVVCALFFAAAAGLWLIRGAFCSRLAFSFGWYAVSILPASNILFAVGTVFAERLFYFPSAGLCLAAAVALHRLAPGDMAGVELPDTWRGRSLLAAALTVTVAMGAVTVERNGVWKNDRELFTDTVRKAPQNVKARLWMGDILARAGRLEESIAEYRRAREIYPDYAPAAANMMVPLTLLHRYTEAIEAGEHSRSLSKDENATVLYNLALAYKEKGDTVTFIDYLSRVLQLDPSNGAAHLQLGLYLWKEAQDRESGRRHLNEALRLKPSAPEAAFIRKLLGER